MINIFVPFLPEDKTSYKGKFFKEIILGLEKYSKEETNIICIEFFKSKNIRFKINEISFLKKKNSSIWIKYSLPIKPSEIGLNIINHLKN